MLSRSQWTHVAVAIVSESGDELLWEASHSYYQLKDYFSHEIIRDKVRVVRFDEKLAYFPKRGNQVMICRLVPPPNVPSRFIEIIIDAFVCASHQVQFRSRPLQLLKAARISRHNRRRFLIHRQKGFECSRPFQACFINLFSFCRTYEDIWTRAYTFAMGYIAANGNELFCAELTALLFQVLGAMPIDRHARYFVPGDFSPKELEKCSGWQVVSLMSLRLKAI